MVLSAVPSALGGLLDGDQEIVVDGHRGERVFEPYAFGREQDVIVVHGDPIDLEPTKTEIVFSKSISRISPENFVVYIPSLPLFSP
jgi:hypothetical protein